MAQIPQYTRGIIRQREVARPFNPQAVENAGLNYGGAFAQVADWADRFAVAEETTATNDAIIRKQKDDIDFLEAKKTEWQNNPKGFTKAIEADLVKRNQEYEKQLPSERARLAFRNTASRIDLQNYEQAVRWEKTRSVEMLGGMLDNSLGNLQTLAFRYGREGGSFDELRANLDATLVAAENVVSGDKIEELRQSNLKQLTLDYLQGRVEADPKSVLKDLDDRKYDDVLGADGLEKAYTAATRQKQEVAKVAWESRTDAEKYELLKQPLSVRNNNPGNIRGADGEFIKYATPEEGQQAMVNDLRIKITGRSKAMEANFGKGYTPTLQNLIATWAPATENDVDAYVANVTKMTGIAANDVLTESDIPKLMEAMTAVEGGAKASEYFATGTEFDDLPAEEKIANLKKLNDYREAYNVQQAILGNGLVDPASKSQRKALNDYFMSTEAAQMLAVGDVNASIYLSKFAKQYGVVPENAQSTLRGMMTSGDAEQKKFAYGTIGELEKANPAALVAGGGFTKQEIQDAAVFNGLVRSGASAKFASDAVTQARQPITADIRKIRQTEADAKLKEISPSSLSDVFDEGILSLEPDFADAAQRDIVAADYKRIYREAFLQYGDAEMAKNAAEAAIKVTSGTTMVGGKKRIMKFPPELYYGVDGVEPEELASVIDQQIKSDLLSLGYDASLPFTLQATPNAEVAVNNGRKPAYNIWVTGENGVVDLVRDERNMPVAIAFDQMPALEIKKKREEDYRKRAQFRQRNIELMEGKEPKRSLQDIMQ